MSDSVVLQTQAASDELTSLIAEAKAKIESGDLEAGVDAFRRIAEANPEMPEVFNNLGAICAAMGRRDEAESAFDRAAELAPDTPNPLYNRGLMRFQGGNYLGARDDFQAASLLSPTDAELLNNLGVSHYQLKEWSKARGAFQKAVELRDDYLAAHLNLVDVDLAEGRLDAATERAEQLTAEHEGPEAIVKLVECRLQRAAHALDQAAEAAEASLPLLPDSEVMRAQLGQIARAKQTLLANPVDQDRAEAESIEAARA